MACAYIKEPPEFSIADGNVHVEFVGSDLQPICLSLRTFRTAVHRAQKMLAEHDARSATVTPIKGRRGRH